MTQTANVVAHGEEREFNGSKLSLIRECISRLHAAHQKRMLPKWRASPKATDTRLSSIPRRERKQGTFSGSQRNLTDRSIPARDADHRKARRALAQMGGTPGSRNTYETCGNGAATRTLQTTPRDPHLERYGFDSARYSKVTLQ